MHKFVAKTLYFRNPTTLQEKQGISLNCCSMTLGQLKEHNLVVCINLEVRNPKFYRMIELGEKVDEQLISI